MEKAEILSEFFPFRFSVFLDSLRLQLRTREVKSSPLSVKSRFKST